MSSISEVIQCPHIFVMPYITDGLQDMTVIKILVSFISFLRKCCYFKTRGTDSINSALHRTID